MDGRLNPEEQKEFEQSGELDALKTVLDDIDTWKVAPFNVEKGLEKLKESNSKVLPLKNKQNKTWIKIAASIALLVICSLLWYFMNSGDTIVTTEIAQNKTIELPLGSTINLDAASRITYAKKDWEKSREITLSGQAFFDVTSGAPFLVSTETATVAVLGTQFNIIADKERFSVYCYEGKIEVSYRGDSKIITKGQQITLTDGILAQLTHDDSAPEWIKGSSSYDKTPLRYVISDLQRYYNVTIVLPKKYNQHKFTGTIEHDNLNSALKTIFTTMELNYTLQNDGKVIVD